MCRCMLTGPCLAGHAHIGGPWGLALHTFDCFGNARASGLEEVTVDVAGPVGTQVRKAAVTDRGNGCYGVAFQPDCEGCWLITPRWALALPGRSHNHVIPGFPASRCAGRASVAGLGSGCCSVALQPAEEQPYEINFKWAQGSNDCITLMSSSVIRSGHAAPLDT